LLNKLQMKGGKKEMRKILLLIVMVTMFSVGVFAISTLTFLTSTGDATAQLSTLHATDGDNSAELWANKITDPTNEARARIEFEDGDLPLGSLTTLSWDVFADKGYMPHADIYIDTDGDHVADETLIFEYAKVNPLDCDDFPYPTGAFSTFDDKGIINDAAWAWLNGPVPGPCNDPAFDAVYDSLTEWKAGTAGDGTHDVDATDDIVAIEIEIDGWIPTYDEHHSFIDNVKLNGELIQSFEGVQGGEGAVVPDFTFIPNPNPLNFGPLNPGQSKIKTATLTVGVTDLEITDITVTPGPLGGIFDETNVMFSTGGAFFPASDVTMGDPIELPHQTNTDLDVKLTVPIPTPSGGFEGVITYTIMEDI